MKDLSFSFLTTGLIQVLNIVTGLLAARLLLPEGRGELAALLLWPGLLAELGSLGLYDALLYRAATRTENPRALFAAMAALTAALSIGLIGIGFIVLPIVFAKHGDDMLTLALYFMCGFLPTYFTSLFSSGLFQGQLQIAAWNVLRLLVPATYLIILCSLLLAAGTNVADFAAAYVAAQAVAGITGIVLVARRGWLSLNPDLSVIKGLLSYGIKVHFGDVLYSMRQRLDQAAIAYWLTSAELGLYAVALTVANGPLILVFTIANVAFPKISQQAEGGKLVVFGRYLRFALTMAAGIILVLWMIVPWLLPLLFGAAFAPAVPIANILLLGTLPLAAKLMFQQALKAWDRPLVVSRAEAVGLIAAAALLAVLMPAFGLVGVAWSLVLSQVAAAGVLAWSLQRNLHINLLKAVTPTIDDWRMARQWTGAVMMRMRRLRG